MASTATAVGPIDVAALPRTFTPSEPEFEQTAVWQNLLQLNGYDLDPDAGQLTVTLHWQALARPDRSYKFFLHLVNTATGELVAQADYIPRDWTYPTDWWAAGEFVVDTAVLPLNDVGSGTYQLLLGLYDPDTGQRLLATSEDSSTPMDAISLTEISR